MLYNHQFPQLKVLFQPICFSSGQLVCGYEAFIRDENTSALPLYEKAAKTNQISFLDKISFSKICREYSQNNIAGKLFINLLSESLTTGSLQPETLLAILSRNNIPPANLVIELVEFSPITDFKSLLRGIHSLKEVGAHISLDGFGFGYSNIARLLEISPEFIKIDARFFIQQDDTRRESVFASIVQLCSILDVCVIAKNVETAAIANTLRVKAGVNLFQGDYFGPPHDPQNSNFPFQKRKALSYREILPTPLSNYSFQEQ